MAQKRIIRRWSGPSRPLWCCFFWCFDPRSLGTFHSLKSGGYDESLRFAALRFVYCVVRTRIWLLPCLLNCLETQFRHFPLADGCSLVGFVGLMAQQRIIWRRHGLLQSPSSPFPKL